MSIISSILSGGAGQLIEKVGGVVDKFVTTSKEKEEMKQEMFKLVNEHEEKMAGIAEQEFESQLKDTQNARDANAKIQDSANASRLAKNIAYILDVIFVTSFLLMLALICFKQVPVENKEIFYTGFGLLGGYVGSIVNFHRGTSAGSQRKSESIDKIIAQKE